MKGMSLEITEELVVSQFGPGSPEKTLLEDQTETLPKN
jgi:hypothetical protein